MCAPERRAIRLFSDGGGEEPSGGGGRSSISGGSGVTAAAGATAYAGIPLTHRDYAQSVTFVTGHLQADSAAHDWSLLAKPSDAGYLHGDDESGGNQRTADRPRSR